jgi:hypothetical protein
MHTDRCGNTDRNVMQKKEKKKPKYKCIFIAIQRMWNLKCKIIPVITGDTGIVTKGLKKNLQSILGKHALHKTVVLETSHIILKVLQSET